MRSGIICLLLENEVVLSKVIVFFHVFMHLQASDKAHQLVGIRKRNSKTMDSTNLPRALHSGRKIDIISGLDLYWSATLGSNCHSPLQ